MRTEKIGIIALLLCLCAATAQAQAPPQVIGTDTLLRQETDLSQLPTLRNWTTHMQSSYDRSGGNGDSQQFLAVNGTTATLADMYGPGAIVRIWSANPGGQLKIYIDDNPTPVIETPFAKLFDNSLPPFAAPLAQPSSGGFYSYLPIPYAKHCLITVDDPRGLYYQVNYLTFAPGTPVRPFALPLTDSDQAALTEALAAWKAPGAISDVLPPAAHSQTVTIDSGKTKQIENEKGSGRITLLQFQAPNVTDLGLRQIVLRGYFDGHTTPDIEAPIADFFGCAYGRRPFTSVCLSQNTSGVMQSLFPMPYGRSARFTLENGTGKPVRVVWNVVVAKQSFHSDREGYFHAQWWQETTRAAVAHVWTKVQGQRGKFVGIVQTMAGSAGLGFLEGDEQFRVDSQVWGKSQVPPTVIGPWNGTGTEDCFNSGWYFGGGPNAMPVNGALIRDKLDGMGRINAYRWFINDAPIFQQSLDGQIEHGGANDAPYNYYSSVAYWYADGQTQPWAATPAASALKFPLKPQHPGIKGAIEGESLITSAKATGGNVQVLDMLGLPSGWSAAAMLFWSGTKVGDTLTLTLPAHPGTFDLIGYFTKGVDYGQVSFTLNGQPVGSGFDAFHDHGVNSGPILMGRVTLPAGTSQLVVTMTGKNPAAVGTLFGLDALCLISPGSPPIAFPPALSN